MRLCTGARSVKSRLRMRSVLTAMRPIDRDSTREATSAPRMAKPTATAAAMAARCSRMRELAASSATGTALATTKRCPSSGGRRCAITR